MYTFKHWLTLPVMENYQQRALVIGRSLVGVDGISKKLSGFFRIAQLTPKSFADRATVNCHRHSRQQLHPRISCLKEHLEKKPILSQHPSYLILNTAVISQLPGALQRRNQRYI